MVTPQLLRFVVRSITLTPTLDGYTVTCYTNNPTHLYFRYTSVEPQKHIHPRLVRGAPVGTFIDQCFVSYHDIEQNEAGDTTTHTFTVEPWHHCTTYWYYFWGTVDGELSPSKSALFSHHSTIAVQYCKTDPLNVGYGASTGCNFLSFPFKPSTSYTITHWKTHLRRHFGYTPQDTFELTLWTADANGVPQALIGYGVKTGIVLPPWPTWTDIDFPIGPTPVTAGQMYAAAWRLSVNFHLTHGERLQQDGATNNTCPHGLPPGVGFYYTYPGYWYPSEQCKDPPGATWDVHVGGGVQYYVTYGEET